MPTLLVITEGKTLEVRYFEPHQREHLSQRNTFKYSRGAGRRHPSSMIICSF